MAKPPVTSKRGRPLGQSKYRTAVMAVGESFFIPWRAARTASPYFSVIGKRLDRKFVVRSAFMREVLDGWTECSPEDPYAIRGVNVWRLK